MADKHLLLMYNKDLGIDEETTMTIRDYIQTTNFYIRLGKVFPCLGAVHKFIAVAFLSNSVKL